MMYFQKSIMMMVAFASSSWSLEIPQGPFLDLKSESFRVREDAQAELVEWARLQPDAAMDELFRQSQKADDPEVRARCVAVLQELVSDLYLREGEGYIGVQMRDELADVPDDPKPRRVIRVVQVMPDSAGERAGLQLNDLIVGLNDLVWREDSALLPFREKIRQFKPDSRIQLKVLRGGKLMGIEVILGRRPLNADGPFFDQGPADLEAAERVAKEAYFRRWLEQQKLQEPE